MKSLTPTMQSALAQAEMHGGRLYRRPGGFWVARPHIDPKAQTWFALGTVRSLVARELMCFSQFKTIRGGGAFAIEACKI